MKSLKIVQVISGSSFVAADQTTVLLAGVESPNFNPRNPQDSAPFGFLCKEFLRNKMIGREVSITELKVIKDSPRTILAHVFIKDSFVNEEILKAGYGMVQQNLITKHGPKQDIASIESLEQWKQEKVQQGKTQSLTHDERLCYAFLHAKLQKVGMFSEEVIKQNQSLRFQDITQKGSILTQFVNSNKNKPFQGNIEHVRDADSFYSIINDQNGNYYKIVTQLFGIQSTNSVEQTKILNEFVQRNAQFTIVSLPSSNIVACLVSYKTKTQDLNLSLHMLLNKTASVVEWMLQGTTYDDMFKDFREQKKTKVSAKTSQSNPSSLEVGSSYSVKIIDVQSSDSLCFRLGQAEHKVFISSLLAPKCHTQQLEDYGIECRQYLRGFYKKELTVHIEYVRDLEQKEQEQTTQRYYGSFYLNDLNIAHELIVRGLCKVVKHKQSDLNRATDYQQYLDLEQKAADQKLGVHGTVKQLTQVDLQTLSTSEQKMKAKSLQKQRGTIEHVMSGGKIRAMMQTTQQTYAICTIALAGCRIPSLNRCEQGSDEAIEFLSQYLFQDVQLVFTGDVEKYTGAYVAVIQHQNQKLSLNAQLLQAGWARFQPLGAGDFFSELQAAECRAKSQRIGLFGSLIGEFEPEGSFKNMKAICIVGLCAGNEGDVYIRPKDLLQIQVKKANQLPLKQLRVGQICLVEKVKDTLVRARIASVENNLTAFLIDYGITITIKSAYEIDSDSCQQCAAAVCCRLAFLDTKFENKPKQLEAFIDEVQSQVKDKEMTAWFVGYEDVPIIFLQVKEGEFDLYETINTYLLEEGFCKYKLQRGGEELCERVGEFEKAAVSGARGIWK